MSDENHLQVHARACRLGGDEMIVDRHPVFTIEKVVLRCNECVRQVSVYVATGAGNDLDSQLTNVGWSSHVSYYDGVTIFEHFCPEHS